MCSTTDYTVNSEIRKSCNPLSPSVGGLDMRLGLIMAPVNVSRSADRSNEMTRRRLERSYSKVLSSVTRHSSTSSLYSVQYCSVFPYVIGGGRSIRNHRGCAFPTISLPSDPSVHTALSLTTGITSIHPRKRDFCAQRQTSQPLSSKLPSLSHPSCLSSRRVEPSSCRHPLLGQIILLS